MFQSLMDDGAAIKRACKAVAASVSKVFNYCVQQEWVDPDDLEKRTLCHELCTTILSDYVLRVCTRVMWGSTQTVTMWGLMVIARNA